MTDIIQLLGDRNVIALHRPREEIIAAGHRIVSDAKRACLEAAERIRLGAGDRGAPAVLAELLETIDALRNAMDELQALADRSVAFAERQNSKVH
jgi:hypothetical protein